MPLTKNQIRAIFEDIADKHWMVHSFGYGNEWKMTDVDSAEGEVKKNYPILWIVPGASQFVAGTINHSYSLFVFDLVKKGDLNQMEVESDTFKIAKDIISVLSFKNNYPEMNVDTGSMRANAVSYETTQDELTGYRIDIVIKEPFKYSSCEAAGEGWGLADPPDPNCPDATIRVNGMFYDTVNAGGTENVLIKYENGGTVGTIVSGPQVQIPNPGGAINVLVNGNTFESGATSDVDVPVINSEDDPVGSIGMGNVNIADSNVTNSDASYSEDIPAEGSTVLPDIDITNSNNDPIDTIPSVQDYEIPDVDWEDSDGSPQSTPYGDPIVCTPPSPSTYTLVDRWGIALPDVSANVNISTHNYISELLSRETTGTWGGAPKEAAMAALITSCIGAGFWAPNKLHGLWMNAGSTSSSHSWNARYPFAGRSAFQCEFGINVGHSALGVDYTGDGDQTYGTEIFMPNLVYSLQNALSFGFCITSNMTNLSSVNAQPGMQNNNLAAINRGNQVSVRPSDERWLFKANSPGGGGPNYTPGSPATDYTGMRIAVTREASNEIKLHKNGAVVATVANASTDQNDSSQNLNSTTWRIGNAGAVSLGAFMGAFYIGQLTAAEAITLDGFLATFEAAVR